ncbi:MAG: YicC family protein [Bacteroidales bacterium]|nr:YicC family protein [Bacteroidales bacterium]
MIQSMTGFGRAEAICEGKKYVVEIRSVNGKNCDVNLKSHFLPRDKELEIKQIVSRELVRGNIDVTISCEQTGPRKGSRIDTDVVRDYMRQLEEGGLLADAGSHEAVLASVLRFPDVTATDTAEMSEQAYATVIEALYGALEAIVDFRIREGESLEDDILSRVRLIAATVDEVEQYEAERIPAVRERLESKLSELATGADQARLEQELVYYIEKLDINEEKVRLRQHCRYFEETAADEQYPGRKFGFIAQEMGREINTMGSKANHAQLQKLVVVMKDELEKIKEQSLNIL